MDSNLDLSLAKEYDRCWVWFDEDSIWFYVEDLGKNSKNAHFTPIQ